MPTLTGWLSHNARLLERNVRKQSENPPFCKGGIFALLSTVIRKIDWLILFILLVGTAVFILKCRIVYPVQYVGHADASAYAEMADSIVHGRGLAVDYISFYFLKYARIVRPEDHWPPLYSFFIAPFFLIMGKSAFAAKLPSLLISSLLFPMVGYLLGRRLSRNKIVGLAVALNILVYPDFFTHSLFCLSDITFAFMVFLTVFFAVKGMDDGRYFYPMGICLGLSCYAKGAGLVLIPAYILFYLACRQSLRRLIQDKRFLHGLGLTLLVLLPWFIRNTIHFHNPIFSTQQFSAGYIGYESWETGTYSLYWGENLPSFFTKLKRGAGFVAQMTGQYFQSYLWWAFVDIRQGWGKFQPKDFYTYITGIPAAFGLAMLLISSLYLLVKKSVTLLASALVFCSQKVESILQRLFIDGWANNFISRCSQQTKMIWGALSFCVSKLSRITTAILLPWQNRMLHLVWLVILSLFLFLSLCWSPINRLTFPATALLIATGWVIYSFVLKGFLGLNSYSKPIAVLLLLGFWIASYMLLKDILSWHKHAKIIAIVILSCLWAIANYTTFRALFNWQRYAKRIIAILLLSLMLPIVGYSGKAVYHTATTSGYPYREGGEAWMAAGRWLKANAPDSVTMTRNPWELHFYSEEKAIQIPLAELDKVLQVAKFYGATHLIPYSQRPALNPWVNGEIPGLKLVYDNMGLQICEIHYELLPDEFR